MSGLVAIECSRPGDPYTMLTSGVDFDVHLAGPGQHGGTGSILCGFNRFTQGVGFSVGGGCTGPGYRHHPCTQCAQLSGDQIVTGTHRNLFASIQDGE